MPRIVVDYDKCTGLGICESIAPDVFEVDDDGSLLILEESPDETRRGELQEAVDGCPTGALSIED
ncbi:ferredoxin [Actinomycetospora endophytica]|uniref:Ferredoxin n=1 Tax=Actinomycetospora endophytica TaxID=2291215 RepID=A0ABS8P8I7_9PSEU|nr:ferredoxin [Actinomycetospora endophytica]MCD2194592.1 ferredoxin [Actinomycetospora endophytica]